MRNNIRIIILSSIVLLILMLLPLFARAIEATSSSAEVTVEPKVTQAGVSLDIKSNIELKSIRIYRKISNGNYVLFYKTNGESTKEKTVFFSRNLLPDTVQLKIVVIDKDGNQISGDIEPIEIPSLPSMNPEETAKPTTSQIVIPTKPTPSPAPSSNPSPSPSAAPSDDKEEIKYNGKKYKVPKGDKVYFLDVQDKNGNKYQGSDCMLICSEGKYGIIDATLSSKASRVVKHLKELGVTELEFIIVSHNHGDHMGGYSKIAKEIPIKTMYVKRTDKGYGDMVKTAKKHGTTVISGKSLKPFDMGNIHFDFYSTKDYRYSGDFNENVNCLGAVATVKGKKIYFAGDMQNDKNRKIYPERDTAKKIGKVNIYKCAHHCYSAQNNSTEAINALKPLSAVATNHKNRSGTETAYNKIKAYTKKDFYWAGNGTVLLNINSSGEISYKQFPEEK